MIFKKTPKKTQNPLKLKTTVKPGITQSWICLYREKMRKKGQKAKR